MPLLPSPFQAPRCPCSWALAGCAGRCCTRDWPPLELALTILVTAAALRQRSAPFPPGGLVCLCKQFSIITLHRSVPQITSYFIIFYVFRQSTELSKDFFKKQDIKYCIAYLTAIYLEGFFCIHGEKKATTIKP